MIVSPGTSRKFWRVTPKQLLLFAKQNAYLPRNVLKVQLLSELNQGSPHSASINLIKQPNRLSWSRESLADEFDRSEEHTSELQSQSNLVCRLLLEKKNND